MCLRCALTKSIAVRLQRGWGTARSMLRDTCLTLMLSVCLQCVWFSPQAASAQLPDKRSWH